MKKFMGYIAIISLLSCSNGDIKSQDDVLNLPPNVPVLTYPSNNLLCTNNNLEFSWEPSIAINEDAIWYEIQISIDNSFINTVHVSTTNSIVKNMNLEKGMAYYWRVRAFDNRDNTSDFSSYYQFYTEGDGVENHLPFAPKLVGPELESVVFDSTLSLEWTGTDIDDDPLVFNVYFGTSKNPDLISESQSEMTYTINTLTIGTIYYWKIEVIDRKGEKTIGPLWSFSTQ